jgi:hypothetical protein
MINLEKPIRVTTIGNQVVNILTVGSAPLPLGENNVRCGFTGADFYVNGACTVKITASTILMEATFSAAGNFLCEFDEFRAGLETHDLRMEVSGSMGATVTAIVSTAYEFCGGVKAVGG